eukprot:CAMPEP_0201575792 /NCGR_PEP_ID=MMETSP0190_2-20130828/21209_1 /ASSEMBLY_ACC=CAM_ASM_000263 /TAXON_ID=37353 /ORGANISM="Rosalina sp." /LENGTH=775 /DNA_ID=CAMNT_0048005865 /DNA_START=9 /DNA_END=2333 /DNA_ORIENTATION=+
MAILSALLVIVTVAYYSHVHAHNGCGADRIKNNKIIQNMNSFPRMKSTSNHHDHNILDGRAQDPVSADADFEAIRIRYVTDQIQSDWSGYSRMDYIVNDVFPAAEAWLEKVVKVRPVNGDLTLARDCNSWYEQSPILKCTVPGTPSNPSLCGDTGAVMPDEVLEAMHVCSNINSCETNTYPAGNQGYTDTDLVIYVTGDSDKDGTDECDGVMGFAAYCETNVYGRPIAGYINLCRESIDKQIEDGVLTWEESLALIIHETFHVLGFSTDGFKSFNTTETVYATTSARGNGRVRIVLPTVVEKAREFYDCSTVDGLELESYGFLNPTNPTSHWDNRVVLNDFMISYVPLGPWYSPFTLAVLADSGWYEINWEYAQEATYGKGEGCTWFTQKCIIGDSAQFDEFCAEQISKTCGEAQIAKSYCPIVEYTAALPQNEQYFDDPKDGGDTVYSDFCPIIKAYSNGDCRLWSDNDADASDFGTGGTEDLGGLISGTSKCLDVTDSTNEQNDDTNACYPTVCFRNSIGEYVGTRSSIYRSSSRLAVDEMTCWADDTGDKRDFDYSPSQTQSFGFTKIRCPIFEDLCYDSNPWICNGHGTIGSDGACICSPGYMGIDCTIEANRANRITYSDTSSLSVYDAIICGGGFDYQETDDNIGILDLTITDINVGTYVEKYFQGALRNWISILLNIPKCETNIEEYNYNSTESSVTTELWYFSSGTTWTDVTDSNKGTVFDNLFASSNANGGYTIIETKSSAGETLPGEQDSHVTRRQCNIAIIISV